MASNVFGMSLAMVLVIMALCGGVAGQSGCTGALMSLSTCLNYVTGNTTSPSSSCCSRLGNVVQSQPQCLCALLNGSGVSLGLTINQTLALNLPNACNLQTPPASQCNAANGPAPSVASPESSPVGSPDESPEDTPETQVPSTPSQTNILPSGESGSKTTDGSTSNGSMIRGSSYFLLSVFFFASFASAAIVGF